MASVALWLASCELGLDDTGIEPEPPEPAQAEVRGLRVVPGDGELSLHFLDAPGAESYTVCWTARNDIVADDCAEDVTSPFVLGGVENGVEHSFVVLAIGEHGESFVVEAASGVAGPPERPTTLRALMDPEDVDHLYTRDVHSDERLLATLWLADGAGAEIEVPFVRGLRFRGKHSRTLPRKSFNIRLDRRPEPKQPGDLFEDFNFRSDRRRAGDRILLVESFTDPSGARIALAFAMYAELGLPAPSSYFADFWLNEYYEGHYVAVERVDREALRGWGLNRQSGEFTLVRDRIDRYREQAPELGDTSSTFALAPDDLGDDDDERVATLQQIYDYRGATWDQDWEALLELLRWVQDTEAGPAWERGLEERFDVDALIDVLAIMEIQYDFDSFYDDYWLYRDGEEDGLWRVIPWDKDLTFGSTWPVAHDYFAYHEETSRQLQHFDNPFFKRTIETLEERIDARVEALYREVFTDAWLDGVLDELEREVEASLLRHPEPAFRRHPGQNRRESQGWWARHVDAVRTFWELRRARLLADPSRSEGPGHFEGVIALDDRGLGWATDATGWVLARVEGQPGDELELRIDLVDAPAIDGVSREWIIESYAGRWSGEVTLYYENHAEATWLPQRELAGRNWELTMVERGREGDRWLPTRVNPFANAAAADVSIAGPKRFALRYRR